MVCRKTASEGTVRFSLSLLMSAECKLRHHKEVTSQMCVKTRITFEVVGGTGMSGEGKQKHYYHVLRIIFAPI